MSSYLLGCDVLGARARAPAAVPWQALSPRPRVVSDEEALIAELLGETAIYEIVGTYDIGAYQKQMNTIKEATMGVAKSLLLGGQKAIGWARSTAASKSLPGGTARDEIYGKLQWHQNAISGGTSANTAIYGSTDDLKRWVMRAFIEANAVEEGAKAVDTFWTSMWAEIAHELAALPAKVRDAVTDAAGGILTSVTGLPLWGWGLIAGGLVLLLGAMIWRVGPTVAGVAASAYLPRRF